MATAPPPPPPPPFPPSCGKQPGRINPAPRPGHAAIPYTSTPVQETNPSSETQHIAEDAPSPGLLPVQNEPQFPPSQEENPSDKEEKHGPVQETNPSLQMTEQQDEAVVQMDPAGEEHSP